MWDAVRISMFCDMNEMFTDGLQSTSFYTDDNSTDYSSYTTRASTSPETNKTSTTAVGKTSDNQNGYYQPQQNLSSCKQIGRGVNLSVASAVALFYRNNRQEAKVNLNTFSNVHPDSIVASDYLTPIVCEPELDDETDEDSVTSISLFQVTFKGKIFVRPPYLKKAQVGAAFALSGNTIMSRVEIYEKVKEMFKVYRLNDCKWQKHWQMYLIHNRADRKLFTDIGNNQLIINYHMVDMSIFLKVKDRRRNDVDAFANNLFDEIRAPELYDVMRQKVEQAKEEFRAQLQQRFIHVPERMLKLETKQGSLVMPARPCFQDNSSRDSMDLNM